MSKETAMSFPIRPSQLTRESADCYRRAVQLLTEDNLLRQENEQLRKENRRLRGQVSNDDQRRAIMRTKTVYRDSGTGKFVPKDETDLEQIVPTKRPFGPKGKEQC